MTMPNLPAVRPVKPAWNKGRIIGQKRPLKPKHVWAIRVRPELAKEYRDVTLFNMAIDSKLRECNLQCQVAFMIARISQRGSTPRPNAS